MRLVRYSLFFFLFSLINNSVEAQSKIYFSSKSQVVEFSTIEPEGVSYFNPSGETVTKEISKVILIFNAKGTFLVPSKLDLNDNNVIKLVDSFIGNKIPAPSTDKVYKDDHTILTSNIKREKKDKDYLFLQDGSVLPKNKLVAVIYKEGNHEIFGSVEKAAEIMWMANDIAQKESIAKAAKAKADADAELARIQEAKQMKERDDAKAKADSIQKATASSPSKNNTTSSSQGSQQNATFNPADSLSQNAKEEFRRKADYKIKQFTNFVQTIIEDDDVDKKNKAIEECVSLFVKNATIEVASLNSATQSFPVRAYLNRLKLLPYTKIVIKWTNVSYVSNIHQEADGKYSGTIIFEQSFEGYKDGIKVYSDVTQKKATVILETFKKFENGKAETSWDVYLGNIAVDQIREK
ncbi:MAG: hypothetical protein ABIN36_12260 [Ferruginibacter sp.]